MTCNYGTFSMAGAVYHWQLTYEPPIGGPQQIPIQAMVTGPELSLQTMNHIIFNALVPDILTQFPIRTYQDPPNTIILDYAPQSPMLQGLRVTLAGHGAGRNSSLLINSCITIITKYPLAVAELVMRHEMEIRLNRGLIQLNIITQ